MNRQLGTVRLPVTAAAATILASSCLVGIFQTGRWFLPSVFAVVVTAVVTEVLRRAPVPRSLAPAVGTLALLEFLVLRFVRDEAVLGLLPGPGALAALGDLVADGRSDIARFAAPVQVSPGIELLTVAGIGLVALVVDTLAVTLRRAALAGLPLLALYTVPTSVAPDGVSWVPFALGGAGYLALLLAEARERVSRWGRPLQASAANTRWRTEIETSPLAQVGRRVGATALGIALVVPAVLPQIDASALGFGSGGLGPGSGGRNTVAVLNPILELGRDLRREEDRPVLRYEGDPTYLRVVGLDEFGGDSWRPSRLQVSTSRNDVEDGLRDPPGLTDDAVGTTIARHRIQVFGLDQQWLPLPYPARRVQNIEGRWVYDPATFNVFSTNTSTRDLTYEVRSLAVTPTAEQLRAAGPPPDDLNPFLELPLNLSPMIEDVARRVTGDAPTAYDQALALQDWLRDKREFTYSTEVADELGDDNGSQAIAAFLRTRQGYCVQFSSTMAVMARQLGIPARVAVGFTAGTPQLGTRLVSLHDAHAWPELYFEGTGWVAFEPTPAQRTGQPPPWAQAPDDGPGATAGAGPSAGAGASPSAPSRPDIREPRGLGGQGVTPVGDQNLLERLHIPVIPFFVVLGLLLLSLVPGVTRVVVRRRRWRRAATPAARIDAAWAELRDSLVDHGYSWPPSDPPRRGATRVVADLELSDEPAQAVRRVAAATERARYATDLGTPGNLRADVDAVRAALAGRTNRLGRARARWLPRSTRSVATAISERVADGLDAVDAAAAAVAGRLRPGRRREA